MVHGMRSNAYDGMRGLINQVHILYKQSKDVLKKAEEEHRGFGPVKEPDEVTENKPVIEGLLKFINSQFVICKQDFDSGKINKLRYAGYLRDLEHLLLGSGKKIISKNLNSSAIAAEIRKFA